jgi:hypothetical protein
MSHESEFPEYFLESIERPEETPLLRYAVQYWPGHAGSAGEQAFDFNPEFYLVESNVRKG